MNLNELKSHALSNSEIETAFKRLREDVNIVYLSKMREINTVDDIFDGKNHAVLFVSTNSEYSGHWQLLLRKQNEILFFDSYGHTFGKLLKKVFKHHGNNAYNQSFKLGNILLKTGIPCVMNTVQYQNYNEEVKTCGFHVLCCFTVFLELDEAFSFNKYFQFMDGYKKKYKLKDYDSVAIQVFAV